MPTAKMVAALMPLVLNHLRVNRPFLTDSERRRCARLAAADMIRWPPTADCLYVLFLSQAKEYAR